LYNLPTPKSNHYLQRYIKFISSRINKISNYYEYHHIIPRSLGGTDDKDNLIKLSAREHYIAHWLLWKSYRNYSMTSAFMMMYVSNKKQIRYYNSKLYESLKSEYSKIQSENMSGENNPFYGKNHTEESKLKMSLSKSGINNSWNTGLSKESNEILQEIGKSISNAVKGMRHWTNGVNNIKSFTCPCDGWYIGRSPNENFKHCDKIKSKMRESRANGNCSWWNNGLINKRQKDKPDGDNWVKGRLLSEKLYQKFCKKVK
jgi:hypothetical protein